MKSIKHTEKERILIFLKLKLKLSSNARSNLASQKPTHFKILKNPTNRGKYFPREIFFRIKWPEPEVSFAGNFREDNLHPRFHFSFVPPRESRFKRTRLSLFRSRGKAIPRENRRGVSMMFAVSFGDIKRSVSRQRATFLANASEKFSLEFLSNRRASSIS